MVTPRHKTVELPKFKRSTSTWSGKAIEYLLNHPSGKPAIDLALEAITSYWLVEALEGKVTEDEFRVACRAAAEDLSKKLASIQQMAGFNTNHFVPAINHTNAEVSAINHTNAESNTTAATPSPINPATSINSGEEDDDDDDDDDWDLNLQLTPELIEINKIFGINEEND